MSMKSMLLLAALSAAVAACGDSGTQPAKSTTPTTPSGGATPAQPVAGAQAAAADSVNALKTEAEKLLTDAATYVKDNKFDLADKAVARLDEIKPKLPAEYGPKIDQLKQLIATGKAAASKLPAGLTPPAR